ncbi:MAG: hypothetical protein H6574_16775 [Lewinellaceae bacterium]|nr:hypothetical protein [Lewinellaceae bacterium]MCB0533386.1 hypothetical protein [Saprospiraceae bacterium]MCB9317138.1 hypothetical protein [Lewinellaceae bacterium]MCB9332727.1 hypothetical protein [Lewinellaceae bacterium]
MFRRHTREPFPVRNIIVLSIVMLVVLAFILHQLKKAEQEPPANQPLIIEQNG